MAQGLTAGELRTSTEDELVAKLREAKEELFNLRFQAATGQLESHGRLRGVRKEIARIYTVMRERELGIVTIADAVEAAEEPAEPEANLAEEPGSEPSDGTGREPGGATADEQGEEPSPNE
jgi:large subunit ribosomal protein L29